MLILGARIIDEECLCVMEEENPAQHILPTPVSHEFWMAPRVPHRNTEMVVAATDVIGNPRLCAGKHKNARFPVSTDFVLDEGRSRSRAIDHYARQNTLRRTALCHSTRGVEQIHRGVLIASNIAKCDAGDTTAWDLLKVEGSSTA